MVLGFGVAALLAIAVYSLFVRWRRLRALNSLRGRAGRPPRDETMLYAAASADALLAGIPLVEAAIQMNEHVFEALDRWVVRSGSPFDLLTYVKEHHATIFAPDNGFIDGLKGYVAESIVADHFAALGHHVVLATATNQPGWDLLIDGHAFQVKAGETAAQAAHHALDVNPDIPVITDPAAVEHLIGIDPHSLLAVNEITAAHLEVTTENTLHGLDAVAHAGSFHLPFVTVALSSWKELTLLESGQTSFETACTHVLTDGLGVGAGMALGAHAGVAAGAIGGPVGMAVGGFIGGLIGGIAGKLSAGAIKEARFHKLLEKYRNEARQARVVFEQERLRAQAEMLESLRAYERNMTIDRRKYSRAITPRRRIVNLAHRAAGARLRLHVRWLSLRKREYRRDLLDALAKSAGDQDLAVRLALIVQRMSDHGDPSAANLQARIEDFVAVFEAARKLLEAEQFAYGRLMAEYDIASRQQAASLLERLEEIWKSAFANLRVIERELQNEALRVGKKLAAPAAPVPLALPPSAS